MFQQKGWQGKERKETQPEQSQGSRHFAVFCLHLKFTEKGLHVQGQPCSPMVPPEQTLEVRCRWFAVLWWVLVWSQLFWGFSFSSSSPLLSFPFLLVVKHLHARSPLMPSACADGFLWLPKGSMRLSGHPTGLEPLSVGGKTTVGDRRTHPSKEEESYQSVCGASVLSYPVLWGDLTLEVCIIHGCLFILTARKTSCNRRCKKNLKSDCHWQKKTSKIKLHLAEKVCLTST